MQAAQSALKQMQAGVEALTATSAEEDQAAQANSSQPPQPGEQMARNSKDGAKDQTPSDDSDAAKRGLHAARGSGHFLGLPERDRAAAQQSQTEKYPQEYGAMIEEYMQSLASDSGGK